jgi:hypothetical protein
MFHNLSQVKRAFRVFGVLTYARVKTFNTCYMVPSFTRIWQNVFIHLVQVYNQIKGIQTRVRALYVV